MEQKQLFLSVLFFFVLLGIGSVLSINSTNNQFSSLPATVFFNWTNNSNMSTNTLNVQNITMTNLVSYQVNVSVLYNITNVTNVTNSSYSLPFYVVSSNSRDMFTSAPSENLSASASKNLSLIFNVSNVAFGRYTGNIIVVNSTNSNENLTLYAVVDIPIVFNQTSNAPSTPIAGNLSSSNTTFFFNPANFSNVVAIRVNFTDFTNPLNFTLFDSTSAQQTFAPENSSSNSTTYNFSTFPASASYWFINMSSYTASNFTATFELLTPSLMIENKTGSSSATTTSSTINLKVNLGQNTSLLSYYYLNNTREFVLVVQQVTNSSALFFPGDSTKNMSFTFNMTQGNFAANTANLTLINVSTNYTLAPSEGLYTGWILVNANGPSAYPNPYFNLSIRVNNTHELNVTILNVSNPNVSYSTLGGNATRLGETFNITARPMFHNGNTITNLNGSNFTVYLTYPVNWKRTNILYNKSIGVPSNLTVATAVDQNYGVNVTVPGDMFGGNYTVILVAKDNSANSLNWGTGTYNYIMINSTMLAIDANVTATSNTTSFVNGGTFTISLNVSNYGASRASNVVVNASASGCSFNTGYPSAKTDITSLAAFAIGNSSHYNNTAWQVTLTNGTSCTVTIAGTSGTGASTLPFFLNDTVTFTWSGTGSGSGTQAPGPAGAGAAGAATTPAGTYLDITDLPAIVYVVQGKSNTTSVTVKNTNDTKTQDFSLKVQDIDSKWWGVTPGVATSITPGNSTKFTVTFTIEEAASVKDYAAKFLAVSTYANITKDFTLRVLPSESTIQNISASIQNYRKEFDSLGKELNKSKSQGYNISFAESKYLELKVKLEDAEAKINSADYFGAAQLAPEIEKLIEDVKTELKNAKKSAFSFLVGGTLFYVLIGIGIGAVALLAYLFWPTKGARPVPKINIPKRPSTVIKVSEAKAEATQKISDSWSELKRKWQEMSKKK